LLNSGSSFALGFNFGVFFKADILGEIWNYFFIMHYSARVGLSVVRTSSKELLFA